MDPKYPIGEYQPEPAPSPDRRRELIQQLADVPAEVRAAALGLSDSQLDTPYRLGGWTVRQVVHHLADSQMHGYIRTKFALAESEPTIKPYDESVWAELKDGREGAIEPSLQVLDGLHHRWSRLLESLTSSDWSCRLFHPERGWLTVGDLLTIYVWHGRHHTAHVTELRKRMQWT